MGLTLASSHNYSFIKKGIPNVKNFHLIIPMKLVPQSYDTSINQELNTTAQCNQQIGFQRLRLSTDTQGNNFIKKLPFLPQLIIPKLSPMLDMEPVKRTTSYMVSEHSIETVDEVGGNWRKMNCGKISKVDVSDICVERLYKDIRQRFTGSRGNKLIMSLVDTANLCNLNRELAAVNNSIVIKELTNLLAFSTKRNMRLKSNAQFDILDFAADARDILNSMDNKYQISEVLNTNAKRYNFKEMAKAKNHYICKRLKRKNKDFIRYEKRQFLANERIRTKGKFVKKNRVDVAQVAREMLKKTQE